MADDVTPEESVGFALRKLRTDPETGMSQRELAEEMTARGHSGWRQGTVSMTEAAQRPLRVNELVDLADIFRVDIDFLLMRNPFHGLTVDEAGEELAKLRVRAIELDHELDAARLAVEHAERDADDLAYERTETLRLIGLLEDFIERGGEDL